LSDVYENVQALFQSFFAQTSTNQGDVALGRAAVLIGAQVATGNLPYKDVGRAIRDLLCAK